jgi:outer membrane receptor protein involved in Fe transport
VTGILLAILLAQADVAGEADLHFTLGAERFRAHDYRAALEHFLASNRLAPNRNVMFNLAETYAQLKQYPDAYRYYAQALEGERDPSEQARIERALRRVAASVAVLRVRSDPPGATVYVDREDLGARGTAPLLLAFPAGKYRILARAPGYEAASSEEIDAKAGSDTLVDLKLVRIERPVRLAGAPAGAEVRADTGQFCALPCELKLPVGRVVLTASAPGYVRARQEVRVQESGNDPLDFDLRQQFGKLVVNTDERGAAVEIDGKVAGFTPAVLEVPVGRRTVRVSLRGYNPVTRTVEVSATEQPSLDVQFTAIDEVSAASRTAESVDDAPSSVSIVTGAELRAMGYPTLAEALRGIRGIFLNDDGTYTSPGVRGYGPPGSFGNKVLVLVDGHSTNDDWANSSYAGYDGRTDLDDIERIEVVRGPGSVLYGTGAFMGVVNLVSKSRSADREASATVGTTDSGAFRSRAAVHQPLPRESGFDVSLSALSLDRHGLVFAGGQTFSPGADGLRSGTATGTFWTGAFTLQAQAVARDRAYPQLDASPSPASHVIDRRAFAEARYEPKLGDRAELLLRGSFDRYTYDSSQVNPPEQGGLARTRFIGDWLGGEARITLRPMGGVRLMIGGEAQDHFHVSQRGQSGLDTGSPRTFLASDSPFRFYAGYALADVLVTPRVHLSAGARLDAYSTFGSSLNPRLALVLKPTDSDVLKLVAGTAFRAPSIYELYYNDGGVAQIAACPSTTGSCTALKPEAVRSGEVELTHHLGNLWTALASLWGSRIINTIELRQAPGSPDGVAQYQNIDRPVRGYGAELEVRREWRQGFMAALNFGAQHMIFENAPLLREVPNSPALLGSFKLAVPLFARALTLMTRLTVEGPRWDRNANPGDPEQKRTVTSTLWDISLSGELPEYHLRYGLSIYNLADWKYDLPLSTDFGPQVTLPQPGRRLLGSLTLFL